MHTAILIVDGQAELMVYKQKWLLDRSM